MPISLNKLKSNTDSGRKSRSSNVKFKHLTTLANKDKYYLRKYVYQTWTESNSKYKTTIYPQNPILYDLENGNAKSLVSCSCPDFLYRLEYVLAKSGNSEIKYSNGEPAVITNPTNKKYMCKHLIAILPDVLNKNKKLVDYIEKDKQLLTMPYDKFKYIKDN